jgi:hypothetical protein
VKDLTDDYTKKIYCVQYNFTPTANQKASIKNAGEDVAKLKSYTLLLEMQTDASNHEHRVVIPQSAKHGAVV